jgi:pimeloyl-ACP methyl ester carboxylesterase
MIAGLITLNTTWFGSNPIAADELERNASIVEKKGMSLVLESSHSYSSIQERFPAVMEHVRETLLKNNPASYALGMRAIAKDFKNGPRRHILSGVKCPALILIGDKDSAPLKGAIDMYEGIKHSRLAVIPSSGHYSLLEKPDICDAVIGDFLGEIRSRPSSGSL